MGVDFCGCVVLDRVGGQCGGCGYLCLVVGDYFVASRRGQFVGVVFVYFRRVFYFYPGDDHVFHHVVLLVSFVDWWLGCFCGCQRVGG